MVGDLPLIMSPPKKREPAGFYEGSTGPMKQASEMGLVSPPGAASGRAVSSWPCSPLQPPRRQNNADCWEGQCGDKGTPVVARSEQPERPGPALAASWVCDCAGLILYDFYIEKIREVH